MHQMEKTSLLYFAYGSNMSVPRIQARIPGAEYVALASLLRHKLTFSKPGIDNSGKCDAVFTGCEDDAVYGVVYRISAADKMVLDGYEGLGAHYLTKPATVFTDNGQPYDIFLYVATQRIEYLKPYHWYRKHVLHGAQEAGMAEEYCDRIAAIVAVDDPDDERHKREMAIYC